MPAHSSKSRIHGVGSSVSGYDAAFGRRTNSVWITDFMMWRGEPCHSKSRQALFMRKSLLRACDGKEPSDQTKPVSLERRVDKRSAWCCSTTSHRCDGSSATARPSEVVRFPAADATGTSPRTPSLPATSSAPPRRRWPPGTSSPGPFSSYQEKGRKRLRADKMSDQKPSIPSQFRNVRVLNIAEYSC